MVSREHSRGVAGIRRHVHTLANELESERQRVSSLADELKAEQEKRIAAEGIAKKKHLEWIKQIASVVTPITAIGALLFTGLSLQQSRTQNNISEQGQITAMFNVAVTNLGSASQDMRLGGIYALQRMMQESPHDQPSIVQILSAFVRGHAPRNGASPSPPPPLTDAPPQHSALPNDVQAALTVLATRDPSADAQGEVVDLDNTELAGAYLAGANLAGANLANSDLNGAIMTDATLSNADLQGAYLEAATMPGVDLRKAVLIDAQMGGANLALARIVEAPDATSAAGVSVSAMVQGADLSGADLTDADMGFTIMTVQNLTAVKLDNAIMLGTDMTGTIYCDDGRKRPTNSYICRKVPNMGAAPSATGTPGLAPPGTLGWIQASPGELSPVSPSP